MSAFPRSRLVWQASLCCGLAFAWACSKAAPSELVYTGRVGQLPPVSAGGGSPPLGSGGAAVTGGTPAAAIGGAPDTIATGGQSDGGAGTGAGGSGMAPSSGGSGEGPPPGFEPLAVACGTTPASAAPFSKNGLLGAIADCAVKRYVEFEVRARALHAATLASEEAHTSAVQVAYRAAISAWQRAEFFTFGPAAPSSQALGMDLRDHIYAWPLASRCKVEEQLTGQAYLQPGFPQTPVNGRGLWAVEYLSFYTGTDNACSPFSPINGGAWAALSGAELNARKAAYARAAAGDIAARAQALITAWDPQAGDYCGKLARAGEGSPAYASSQAALNAVSDALFYLEVPLRDDKLGKPLGLVDCPTTTCPEAVESRYAGMSVDHLRANIAGMRDLLEGCGPNHTGLGFDDWLAAVGAEQVRGDLLRAVADLEAALGSFDLSLEQALAVDVARVQQLYLAVKAVTDVLKAEVVTVLNLGLPDVVASDND
jgi:predicted lipoprotein